MDVWSCANCGKKANEKPNFCISCGLVQGGVGTEQKYEILKKYCYSLSLIMRNQGFEHYFIDACAGSGITQTIDGKILEGSAIIMAKTRAEVEMGIKDKSKKPEVICKFIECHPTVFKLLKKSLTPYSDFAESIPGDCNEKLPKILEKIESAFSFVYIDPFGLGDPPIKPQTLELILKKEYTETFIHFSWEAVSRCAGMLKNLEHPDVKKRKLAEKHIETLNLCFGDDWQKIENKGLIPSDRQRAYLRMYEDTLKKYYSSIQYIEIPINSANPSYFLFFTSRNNTGSKIMKEIIEKIRRGNSPSLMRWF